MVIRIFAFVAALATVAHADSPKLEQARIAIDEVRFDDAQRLLVGALDEGGNSPAAVREIYKLSASTAVVLGQRDIGEQYYRRWLALDATASVGAEVAPKLREPFVAAQAYIAAHGRLTVVTTRLSAAALDVAVTDPLAMAVSATIVGGTPVALSTERRARLVPTGPEAVAVALLDDHGNRLVELTAEAAPSLAPTALPQDPALDPYRPEPKTELGPASKAWLGFAIPSVVMLGLAVGFGTLAGNYATEIDEALEESSMRSYQEVVDSKRRFNISVGGAAICLGVGVVLAVPAAVMFVRSRKDRKLIPFVGDDSAGAAIVGTF